MWQQLQYPLEMPLPVGPSLLFSLPKLLYLLINIGLLLEMGFGAVIALTFCKCGQLRLLRLLSARCSAFLILVAGLLLDRQLRLLFAPWRLLALHKWHRANSTEESKSQPLELG